MPPKKPAKKPTPATPDTVRAVPAISPARRKLLDRMASSLNKKFGADAAVRLGTGRANGGAVVEALSTGIDVLDHYLIGCGGLPIGRMVEVYGAENSGKTALVYQCMKEAQGADAVTALVDSEGSFDESRAAELGVDPERVMVSTPSTLEECFEHLKMILDAHDPAEGPLLLAWDSIAGTQPSATGKADAMTRKGMQPGTVARITSEQFPVVMKLLKAKRAALLVMNQTRVNLGVMFGNNTATPGGNAPKFFASTRLQLMGGSKVLNAKEEHVAKDLTFLATKTRFVPPFRKARIRLVYASGYDNDWTLIEWAKTRGYIEKALKGADALAAARAAVETHGWGNASAGLVTAGNAHANDEEAAVPVPDDLDDDGFADEEE